MRSTARRTQTLIGLLGIFLISGPWPGTALAQKKGGAKNAPPGQQMPKPGTTPAESAEYRVGAGDVISISVWREPEVSSPSVVIRPDGKISLPLVNDLYVSGMTPMEIQKLLADKLEPFIKSPNVTVIVGQIRSKKVYLVGQIHNGAFDITQPTTILQLLTQAGGVLPFAKSQSIYVLRTVDGKQQKLPFNYKEVLKGKKMEQNILLQPGDTVVVP